MRLISLSGARLAILAAVLCGTGYCQTATACAGVPLQFCRLSSAFDIFPSPGDPEPPLFTDRQQTYIDPVFGTVVKRITTQRQMMAGDPQGDVGSGVWPDYAKTPIWNCDGTLLMLWDGHGYIHLLDGRTYKYLRTLTGEGFNGNQSPEPRWSSNNPRVFYFVFYNKFMSYDVQSKRVKVVHDFSGLVAHQMSVSYGDEGNPSVDDRYWAFYVVLDESQKYGHTDLIVYDLSENRVIARKRREQLTSIAPQYDWVGMSPDGDYVIVYWNSGKCGTEQGNGAEQYDRNLTYIRNLVDCSYHADVGYNGDGDEAFVGMGFFPLREDYSKLRAIRLRDGERTSIFLGGKDSHGQMQSFFGEGYHISMRNTKAASARGWALLSTYANKEIQSGLFFAEALFLKIPSGGGTQTATVRRLSHTQSIAANYSAEPHCSVNFQATKVACGSNWRNPKGQVETYVVELAAE